MGIPAWKDNHIKFFDDVTMNHNGRLQNGIQPAACICKQLKTPVYFIFVIIFIFLFYALMQCGYQIRNIRIADCYNRTTRRTLHTSSEC